jgi:hypothetical protein
MKLYVRFFLSAFVLPAFLYGCSNSSNRDVTNPASNVVATEAKPTEPAAPPAPVAPAPAPKPAKAVRKDTKVTPPSLPEPPPAVPAAAPAPLPAPPAVEPQREARPPIVVSSAPPEPTTRQITIPSGTQIAVRMIDSVDSKTDDVGQTFRASVDSAVLVEGQVVLPKGGDVYLKLKQVSSAGELRGRSELRLELTRIDVAKRAYTVQTNVYETAGEAQGTKTAKNTGIGAAIGAAIGAIAGGKKGAAIGAGVGAGSGVAISVITKGEQVRVPSETRIVFSLQSPVEITLPIASSHP